MTEKPKAEAEIVATQGWKWIEVAVSFPYGHDHGLRTRGRVSRSYHGGAGDHSTYSLNRPSLRPRSLGEQTSVSFGLSSGQKVHQSQPEQDRQPEQPGEGEDQGFASTVPQFHKKRRADGSLDCADPQCDRRLECAERQGGERDRQGEQYQQSKTGGNE